MQRKYYRKIAQIIKNNNYTFHIAVLNNQKQEFAILKYRFNTEQQAETYTAQIKKLITQTIFAKIIEFDAQDHTLNIVCELKGISLNSYLNNNQIISQQILLKWVINLLNFQLNILKKKIQVSSHFLKNMQHLYVNRLNDDLILIFPELYPQHASSHNYISEFMHEINKMLNKNSNTGHSISESLKHFKIFSNNKYYKHLLQDLQSTNIWNELEIEKLLKKLHSDHQKKLEENDIPHINLKGYRSEEKFQNPFRKLFFLKNQIKQSPQNHTAIKKMVSFTKKHQNFVIQNKSKSPKISYLNDLIKKQRDSNKIQHNPQKKNNLIKIPRFLYLQKQRQKIIQSEQEIKQPQPISNNRSDRKNFFEEQRRKVIPFQEKHLLTQEYHGSIEKNISNEKKNSIRKENKIERKLIIRNPFEKRQRLLGLIQLNQSIIQKKQSEISEDTPQLANIINSLEVNEN